MVWCVMRGLVAFVVVAMWSSHAYAQSDDAVLVLFNGGVSTVGVHDLTPSEPRQALNLGSRRVVPEALGLVRISDIKVLPDGSHLLADVDGRGAAVTSPSGAELRWELDPFQRLPDADCATVASYFAPGEPSLVASGDSASSNVTIRNTSQGTTGWFANVRLATSRAVIPQVVVMRDNEIAIAINWTDIGVYGIRIVDTTDPIMTIGREILSEPHLESGPDAVVVPELDVLRDLMVLEDGRMLVTTRFQILILAADGTLDEVLDGGTIPELRGELASVRVLPSGLFAIATFEPGLWIQPHTNHRVHWYDPVAGEVLATSEPLSRAPLRVEAYEGTGGTNTVGYDGGLDLIQQGDPEDIELAALLIPPTAAIGTNLVARGVIQNSGPTPVGLGSVTIRASSGACLGALQAEVDLAIATSVAVNPGQQFAWQGAQYLDASFAIGPWCAFVQGRDQQGVLRDIGEPVGFEIVEATQGNGSIIDVRPVPFNTGPEADMGSDGGDGGGAGEAPPPDDGCCASVADRRPTPWGLLLALGALASRRLWGRGRARP